MDILTLETLNFTKVNNALLDEEDDDDEDEMGEEEDETEEEAIDRIRGEISDRYDNDIQIVAQLQVS